MREILFRAKCKLKSKWMYGSYRFSGGKHYINSTLIYEETLGQFTGLTDKNGTKIFEGDIVQYFNGTPAHIMFLQGGFIIVGEGFRNEFIGHAIAHIEVIGNIHEKGETE